MAKLSLQAQDKLQRFWKNPPRSEADISMRVSTSSTMQSFIDFPRTMCSLSYDVFPKLEDLYVLKTDTDWIDIGSPGRLQAAQQLF